MAFLSEAQLRDIRAARSRDEPLIDTRIASRVILDLGLNRLTAHFHTFRQIPCYSKVQTTRKVR